MLLGRGEGKSISNKETLGVFSGSLELSDDGSGQGALDNADVKRAQAECELCSQGLPP